MNRTDKDISCQFELNSQLDEFRSSPANKRQSFYDHTKAPLRFYSYYCKLKQQIEKLGIPIKEISVNVSDFNAWRQEFVELDQFYQGMQEVHIEKCLEHYLSFILLDLSSKDVFIDIAAAGSIFAGLLKRKFGLESYRLDLIYPQGINGNEIGANAVYTALPSEFATALTLHCAYECFVGETDITFMDEAERILAPEGKLVIVPLYLNDTYFISTSPYCNLKEVLIDPGACKVWRDDEYHEPFSRHYSPEIFADRIYKNMPQTLNGTIYFVSNLPELIRCYPGQRIYAYFLFKADKL